MCVKARLIFKEKELLSQIPGNNVQLRRDLLSRGTPRRSREGCPFGTFGMIRKEFCQSTTKGGGGKSHFGYG
eukprot:8133856-Pyramimonas_sp.AAC.2